MRAIPFLLALAACQSGPPPPRVIVQKQGDVVVQSPQTVQNQDVVIRDGHMTLQGRTTYRLEESSLRPVRQDPFPGLTVDQFAQLELDRSKIEEFEVRVKGNGRASLTDSTVGRIVVENKGELRAIKSRISEVVVTGEARVLLVDCQVGDLTLRLQGVSAEFSDLKSGPPGDFAFEKAFSCTLEKTAVRLWKFIVANRTHVTFEKCGELAIVFEVRDEVVTFDDLAPGPVSDRIVSTRTAAINVALRDCGVAEWGLRGTGAAVLGVRKSVVGQVTGMDRSRVLLIESATSGREVVARDSSTVEFDRSRAVAGTFHARQRSRLKMTRSTVEDGASFYGWDDALVECWEMRRPQTIKMHDASKLLVEGHEILLDR